MKQIEMIEYGFYEYFCSRFICIFVYLQFILGSRTFFLRLERIYQATKNVIMREFKQYFFDFKKKQEISRKFMATYYGNHDMITTKYS